MVWLCVRVGCRNLTTPILPMIFAVNNLTCEVCQVLSCQLMICPTKSLLPYEEERLAHTQRMMSGNFQDVPPWMCFSRRIPQVSETSHLWSQDLFRMFMTLRQLGSFSVLLRRPKTRRDSQISLTCSLTIASKKGQKIEQNT